MYTEEIKNKIAESLDKMNNDELHSVYFMLEELINQKKINSIEPVPTFLNKKIEKGIEQLNKGEGTEFSSFLNEMKHKYGEKK